MVHRSALQKRKGARDLRQRLADVGGPFDNTATVNLRSQDHQVFGVDLHNGVSYDEMEI